MPDDITQQNPEWEVRVHLNPTGSIHDAKVYQDGELKHERIAPADGRTTLEDILHWANRRTGSNGTLNSSHLTLA